MKTPVFSSAAARSSVFFAGGLADVLPHLVRLDPLDELVLRCEHEEGRAEERVRARREDGDVLTPLVDPEDDLGAFATGRSSSAAAT